MKHRLLALAVFLIQLFLVFRGQPNFGVWMNPVLLTLVTFAVPYLWWVQRDDAPGLSSADHRSPWLWALAGALIMGLCTPGLAALWRAYPNPREWSDVLPQIEALYTRYMSGEFPYAPVDMGTYQPFPVYMPMHWLPVGLSDALNIDTRWSGFLVLVGVAAVFGYWTGKTAASWVFKAVSVVLPSLVVWAYVLWGKLDLPVSYELIIAAYYLLLGTGLMARHWFTLGLGLLLCLLSRYTLVFWLPLLAVLAWFNYPKSISIKLWGTALLSLVLCFALFYAEKPEVWKEGIQYHNHAAVDEWKGYGDPPVSYSMERGIHFAKHLKAVFAGDMQQRVFKARIVQASVMLGMLAFGLGLFYFVGKKHRKSVDPLHFSLLFLYGFVWAFYFFGPLTYRYYLIAPLLLSAVITSMVWTGKTAEGQAGS